MTEEATATNGALNGAQSSPSVTILSSPSSQILADAQQPQDCLQVATTTTSTTIATATTKTKLDYSTPSSCKRLRLSDEFIQTVHHHNHHHEQQQLNSDNHNQLHKLQHDNFCQNHQLTSKQNSHHNNSHQQHDDQHDDTLQQNNQKQHSHDEKQGDKQNIVECATDHDANSEHEHDNDEEGDVEDEDNHDHVNDDNDDDDDDDEEEDEADEDSDIEDNSIIENGQIGEEEEDDDEEDDDDDDDDDDEDDDDDDDEEEEDDDEDDDDDDEDGMHVHVEQQQVGANTNGVEHHNNINSKYALNTNNNIIYDLHHNHLHHHHHHHNHLNQQHQQPQQQQHHLHHHHHHHHPHHPHHPNHPNHHHHQPHLHPHHHNHHHSHHNHHNPHQSHLHQLNHNPMPLHSQNHQQQQQMQQIEQQHDQTNPNHHQQQTLMNSTTTETINNHNNNNNNNDLKHQNTDNLNNISHHHQQQQQNSNWELFHKSINKLRRSQSGAEPNLLRSVLICNLLRKLERDMDEDGIKINYGPDGIPTIVNSNQEITMLDPPPTSITASTQIAVTHPHATDTATIGSNVEGEDRSSVLEESVATSNTSSTNENPHLSIENDCVKHFLDLDMISSGRVTPFPSITVKCTSDDTDEPLNDDVDTIIRAQSTSPPRSPTPSSDDDCGAQDAFSITTLSSDGNSSSDAVSISDHHSSMTSVPSYLSLDSGLESSVIQSAVSDITSLDNHTTTILNVSSSTIKSSDNQKSSNNTISSSNNIASPASYALLYTSQNGEESFADLDWSLYDFDLLMSHEYVGSSHASSSSSSASSMSSNGSVTQWSTTLPSSSSSSLSSSSPLSSTLDVVITNIYD